MFCAGKYSFYTTKMQILLQNDSYLNRQSDNSAANSERIIKKNENQI